MESRVVLRYIVSGIAPHHSQTSSPQHALHLFYSGTPNITRVNLFVLHFLHLYPPGAHMQRTRRGGVTLYIYIATHSTQCNARCSLSLLQREYPEMRLWRQIYLRPCAFSRRSRAAIILKEIRPNRHTAHDSS